MFYLINEVSIKNQKEKYKSGDTHTLELVNSLAGEAGKVLTDKPYTVTDKDAVPPSGDKRDYMSIATYFWPNPDTADGLPYVGRDGRVNPELHDGKKSDRKRFGDFVDAVNTLATAYYYTDNQDYRRHGDELIRIWFVDEKTRMNPNMNYAQGVPGVSTGSPAGIISTHLVIELIDSLLLLESDYIDGVKRWMSEYVDWLTVSEFGIIQRDNKNNIALWYDAQMAAFALFCGEAEQAQDAIDRTKKRIDEQLKSDGSMPEELRRSRAFHYTMYAIRALLTTASVSNKCGINLWNYVSPNGKSIRSAFDFVLPYFNEEKKWEYQQIEGMNYEKYALYFNWAYEVYGDLRYKQPLEKWWVHGTNCFELRLRYPI